MGAGKGRARRAQAANTKAAMSTRTQRNKHEPTSEGVSSPSLTEGFPAPITPEFEASYQQFLSLNHTLFFSARPTPALSPRPTQDQLDNRFDTIVDQFSKASEDATWQEFVASLRADRDEILAFNRLPIVTECQKQARHASGGKFQQPPLVLFYDLPGAFANPTWGVAVIPKEKADWLSGKVDDDTQKRNDRRISQLEKADWIKDDVAREKLVRREIQSMEKLRAGEARVAQHMLVHECVHLTQHFAQRQKLGDAPNDAEKAILEGVTELLTRHELQDGVNTYYDYECSQVIKLLQLTKKPVSVARMCSSAGWEQCLPTLASELGIEAVKIRALYKKDGLGLDADSQLRRVLDSRWYDLVDELEKREHVVL